MEWDFLIFQHLVGVNFEHLYKDWEARRQKPDGLKGNVCNDQR